jgi:hypothetical protein
MFEIGPLEFCIPFVDPAKLTSFAPLGSCRLPTITQILNQEILNTFTLFDKNVPLGPSVKTLMISVFVLGFGDVGGELFNGGEMGGVSKTL